MPDDNAPRSRPSAAGLWRALAPALLVGLVLRLAFGLLYWTDKPLTRDEREYLSLARSLSAGRGFTYDEEARTGGVVPFSRAPGYPAFLAIVGVGQEPVTAVPTTVKIVQSVIALGGVLLVGLIAYGLAGPPAAVAATWLAAVYPPLVWTSSYAFSEAVFWPLGLFAAWLVDRSSSRRSHRWGLAAGLAIGAGILVRSGFALAVPLTALTLAWRRQFALAGAIVIGAALVVAPWTARNYLVHGRPIAVAADGGVTFWTGNHPLAIGEGDLAANPPLKFDDARFRAEHPGLTAEQLEPLYYEEALSWMAAHPVDWIQLELRKLFYLIVPIGPSYRLHSPRYYTVSVASYITVLMLALVGLRRRIQQPVPAIALFGIAAIAGALVFFPQERFRLPVLDPALVIFAAVGMTTFLGSRGRA
jgi:hypothetical protein